MTSAAGWILHHAALGAAGTGLVALLALAMRWFTRRDVVVRHRVLAALLPVAIAIVPLQIAAEAIAPAAPVAGLRRAAAPIAPIDLRSIATATPRAGVAPSPSSPSPAVPGAAAPARRQMTLSAAAAAYAAIAAAAIIGVVLRCARGQRLNRRARPADDPLLRALFDETVAAAGVRRAPRLLESSEVAAPACWGLASPAVVLPANTALRLDADALRCAMRHELEHLRRRDAIAALLDAILVALFWFHPLVHAYAGALRRDRELSCDALVVRATRRPRTYALALLACSDNGAAARRTNPTPLAPFAAANLHWRIAMIGRAERRIGSLHRRLVIGAAGIAAAALASFHGLVAAALAPEEDGAIVMRIPAAGGMRAEILAPSEGREPAAILEKGAAMFAMRGLRADFSQPGSWMTDQETLVSAERARFTAAPDARTPATLEAEAILLNLPEGSGMRAVFAGDRVIVEPGDETTITVHGGEVRLVDATGVVRVTGRARRGEPLQLSATIDAGEVAFVMRGGGAPVTATIDDRTGVPENEAQPPHGAVRWWIGAPAEGEDEPFRVKMQWVYDMHQVQQAVERER